MAQLKNTTISDTGSLNLPAGTTAQRPASPSAGMIRYNTTINDTEYYDGSAWRPISDSNPEATGGTIVDTDIGGVPYRIHYFTDTGNSTFTVSKGGEVEYLIVAGGGGGGANHAGGGGAGGLLSGTTTVTPQTYNITVGIGGATAPVSNGPAASNGGNSSALGFTAIGGGGGGNRNDVANDAPGRDGGSGGGGGGSQSIYPVNWNPGQGTAGQGNAGGVGIDIYGGGGGGAGSVGRAGSPAQGGIGGQGILSSITGVNLFYAAGGGGGYNAISGGGGGGSGIGGSGGVLNGDPGTPGVPNTGSGGGGGGAGGQPGSSGGSGIVVVRYRRNASTATNPNRIESSTLPNNLEITNSGLVFFIDPNNANSWNGSTLTDIAQEKTMTLGANTIVENRFGITHFSSTEGSFGSGTIDTGVRYGLLESGDRVVSSTASWTAISTIYKESNNNPNNWWHIFTDGLSGDIFTIFTDGAFRTSMNQTTYNGTWAAGSDITYSGVNWATMKLGWNFFGVEYDRDNSRIRCFVDNGSLNYSSYATGQRINDDYRLRNFHGWGSPQGSYHSDAPHGPTLVFQRRLLDGEVKDVINKLRAKYNGLS